MNTIYDEQTLRQLAASSLSVSEMVRKMGKEVSGGRVSHVKKKLLQFEIDISHFKQQPSKGLSRPDRQRSPESILVLQGPAEERSRAYQLKRALLAIGREYQCECGVGDTWNGKPNTLEIDHINGNNKDQRASNLRFICRNCHGQTETYGNKKRPALMD